MTCKPPAAAHFCHIFLTGQPSVGKTTIIKAVIDACANISAANVGENAAGRHHNDGDVLQIKPHVKLTGLYTEESRGSYGQRVGFDLVCFMDKDVSDCNSNTVYVCRTQLSRAQTAVSKGKPFVGKYLVDIDNVDKFGVASLNQVTNALQSEADHQTKTICILDEVGKMEMLCPTFLPAVHSVMDAISGRNSSESKKQSTSNTILLGTIPTPRYGHVIQAVEDIRSRQDVIVLYVTKSNRDEIKRRLVAIIDLWIDEKTINSPVEGIKAELEGYLYQRPIGSGSMNTSDKTPAAKVQSKEAMNVESNLVPCNPLIHTNVKPRVLILGRTASPKPMNNLLAYSERSMWKILSRINELPHEPIKEIATNDQIDNYQLNVNKTLESGICIWDVLANVHVKGGQRGSKRKKSSTSEPNDIPTFLNNHKSIQTIGFIGTKAHHEYVKQFGKESLERYKAVILPSSSPANSRMSMDEKVEVWKEGLLG